jgi:hypothetical protein
VTLEQYFHPRTEDISIVTDEYDGTYGASHGQFRARQCLVCAALVDAGELERHAEWHERYANLTAWWNAVATYDTSRLEELHGEFGRGWAACIHGLRQEPPR